MVELSKQIYNEKYNVYVGTEDQSQHRRNVNWFGIKRMQVNVAEPTDSWWKICLFSLIDST